MGLLSRAIHCDGSRVELKVVAAIVVYEVHGFVDEGAMHPVIEVGDGSEAKLLPFNLPKDANI